MLMADTMAYFFVIIGLLVAFPGLWLLCRGLWPHTVEKTKLDCSKTLWKPFLVGLPHAAIVIVLAGILNNKVPQPIGGILTLLNICLFLIYASSGVAGLATVIGERLPSPADAASPWKATIRGGVIMELSFLLPILGWFVLLPASIIIGAGATTRACLKRDKKKDTASGAPAVSTDGDNLIGTPAPAAS